MFPSHMFICTDCNGSDVSIESILISVLRGNQEATRNTQQYARPARLRVTGAESVGFFLLSSFNRVHWTLALSQKSVRLHAGGVFVNGWKISEQKRVIQFQTQSFVKIRTIQVFIKYLPVSTSRTNVRGGIDRISSTSRTYRKPAPRRDTTEASPLTLYPRRSTHTQRCARRVG
jgi:hypothetical protein